MPGGFVEVSNVFLEVILGRIAIARPDQNNGAAILAAARSSFPLMAGDAKRRANTVDLLGRSCSFRSDGHQCAGPSIKNEMSLSRSEVTHHDFILWH